MTMVLTAEKLIAAARGGQGGGHFIVGGAGLGKTTTLDGIVRSGAATGIRIAWAQGAATEQALPFALVMQLAAGLPPPSRGELLSTPWPDQRHDHSWADLATRLLDQLADEPTLVVIDDLHWADSQSLQALGHLCRRIRSRPLAVIAATRPWPGGAAGLCLDLASTGHASLERLRPLTEAAATALLASGPESGFPAGRFAEVWARCGGNPRLLRDVIGVRGDPDGGIPDTGAADLGVSEGSLHSILAGLGPAALRCAEAAGVLGSPFSPEVALEIAQFNPAEGDRALDDLCRSGVLQEAPGGELEFAQEVVRDAIYGRVSAPVRARLHARAFAMLARRGFESRAAEHASRAGLAAGPEAVPVLAKVAQRAMYEGLVMAATEHLGAAVDLAGDHAGFALRLALGQALLAAGRPIAAGSVLQRLLGRSEPAPDAAAEIAALRALGRACHAAGRRASSTAHSARAAQIAGEQFPGVAADALVDQALVGWQMEGVPAALELTARARELAVTAGDAAALSRTEAGSAHLRLLGGDSSGLAALEDAATATLAGSLRRGDPGAHPLDVVLSFVQAGTAAGRLREANRFAETALSFTAQPGSAPIAAPLMVARADTLIRLGRLGDALAVATAAVEASRPAPGTNALARAIEAHALLQIGRVDDSEDSCRKVDSLVREGQEPLAMLWTGHVRAQRELLMGDAGAAAARYVHLERAAAEIGLEEPCVVPWAMHALLAHLDAGDIDRAEGLTERIDRVASGLPCAWPRTAVAVGRALLAERRGQDAAAEHQHRTALALAEGGALEMDRIFVLWRYGGFLRRAGRQVEARGPLAEGLRLAEQAGAGELARQLAAEVTVAGGRRSRRGSHGDALTPQEIRIVDLAAGGRTNREIAGSLSLSVNTVETHLQRAFAKLGVTARLQLATAR